MEFAVRLGTESQAWVAEGLIDAGQRQRLLERYHLAAELEHRAGPSRLVTILAVLGGILLGVGVLLFVAANWRELSSPARLGLIFTLLLGSHGAGWWLRYERQTAPRTGAALLLLGCIGYGAGIFLVAQLYHVGGHYPNGFLLWGVGVLPLAYLLRLRSLLFLSLLLLLIWLGCELPYWQQERYGRGFLGQLLLISLAGVAFWGVGRAHAAREGLRELALPYLALGMPLTLLGGFVLTFDVYGHSMGDAGLWPFYLGVTLLFLVAAVLRLAAGSDEPHCRNELLVLCVLALVLVWLGLGFSGVAAGEHWLPVLAANLAYLLLLLGCVALGVVRRDAAYVNVGLLFFALDVLARYFDTFFKLLPRSLFFIGGGVLLLAGSLLLERQRRRVLAAMRGEGP